MAPTTTYVAPKPTTTTTTTPVKTEKKENELLSKVKDLYDFTVDEILPNGIKGRLDYYTYENYNNGFMRKFELEFDYDAIEK